MLKKQTNKKKMQQNKAKTKTSTTTKKQNKKPNPDLKKDTAQFRTALAEYASSYELHIF